MRSVLWLDRWRKSVPWRIDANGHVCLKSEASLSNTRIPLEELRHSEITKGFCDGEASISRVDSIVGRAIGGANGA